MSSGLRHFETFQFLELFRRTNGHDLAGLFATWMICVVICQKEGMSGGIVRLETA